MKIVRFTFTAFALVATLFLVACQSHHEADLTQLGQPAVRLVGHWADANGNNLFYGPVDATSQTGNFFVVNPDGQTFKNRYQIVNQEPGSQTVEVTLLYPHGKSQTETNVIAADGTTLTAGMLIDDHYISEARSRVDNATVAPKSFYMAGVTKARAAPPQHAVESFTQARQSHASFISSTNRERAFSSYASYLIELYAVAVVILLLVPLMYLRDLGWPTVIVHWGIAIAGSAACLFLLRAPIITGIFAILVGVMMLVRAVFPRSSLS